MSKGISRLDMPFGPGICVQVEHRAIKTFSGIGIILEYQLVELDQDLFEYLYTVHTSMGIDDYWAYEIKPVNPEDFDYNSIDTSSHKEIKYGSEYNQ